MKLLVFAHTPPPYHGQSHMVKLTLDGMRAVSATTAREIELYHVDARISDAPGDVGRFRWAKIALVLRYCAQAVRMRMRGADVFYYVPAAPRRTPLYRDYLVMLVCRFWFRRLVLHWHASGLGEWLAREANAPERWLARALLGSADLSIVLSDFARADAELLRPRKTRVLANGIPDPCPNFETAVWPQRMARCEERRRARGHSTNPEEPVVFRVLFIGTCSAAKGLFVTLDAVEIVNRDLADGGSPLRVRLRVAGEFASEAERELFERRAASLNAAERATVEHVGFVAEKAKEELLATSDCLCFPTAYAGESQPLVVIEALAFGLPVVATRWRSIPEMLEGTENRLVDGQDPSAVARELGDVLLSRPERSGRERFVERFELRRYIESFTAALRELDPDAAQNVAAQPRA